MKQLSYVIVGSGYRAAFYGRIASRYPDLFRAMFYSRSEEKAKAIHAASGLPASSSVQECLAFRPDFAVIAVTKAAIADVAEQWLQMGLPAALETPASNTPARLNRIWELSRQEPAKITVFEQYYRYPVLAAGLKAVTDGKIGTPQSVMISLAHDYHAASLIRRILHTEGEDFILTGMRQQNHVTETDSRYGPVNDGRMAVKNRDTILFRYASGKTAVYDFCGVQYHSFIRSRHLTVRGDRGEWCHRMLSYVNPDHRIVQEPVMPLIEKQYQHLDTKALQEERRTWSPFLQLSDSQDEFAIAAMLWDMREYLECGKEAYPLKEALTHPGKTVVSEKQIWE